MTQATFFWSLALVSGILVLGWSLSYTAGRLDRLHHKVTAARTALDVQLLRRSAAAVDAARLLDPSSALLVTDAASQAMAVAEQDADAFDGRDPLEAPPELETTESDLTRVLHLAFPRRLPVGGDPFVQATFETLGLACTRVQLARRFYNDAVSQVVRVRRKRMVRWARLAGRAPMPQMIEFDDATPPGLSS